MKKVSMNGSGIGSRASATLRCVNETAYLLFLKQFFKHFTPQDGLYLLYIPLLITTATTSGLVF